MTQWSATTTREKRLVNEFERMLAILRPGALIDFLCAGLSIAEAKEYLAKSASVETVKQGWAGFLQPSEFMARFPGRPPEKYIVRYTCLGLAKSASGQIANQDEHAFEVIFGYDYPAKPPRYVWLTPIWHPNIRLPYLCTQGGRPFASGMTLDQICLMVGQMIQYRNYNLADPLDREAAAWAGENRARFPVDTRDLLDGQEHTLPAVTMVECAPIEFVDEDDQADSDPPPPLVDLI